ncbi:MAG: hypothetical protein IKP54_11130 [Bacteroidales bacterium]|nr:hypothetical protein [Bacteroidales bacterium]MBR6930121.1 hypothetical protein [Bacteroidales bacterium]
MEELKKIEFKCPICHKSHPFKDCMIEKRVINSEHLRTEIHGRRMVSTYLDTYKYARICYKCAKKIKITKIVLMIIFFGVLPILLGWSILSDSIKTESEVFYIVGEFIFSMIMIYIAAFIIYGVIIMILQHTFFEIDFEQAKEDNAVLSISEIYDYKSKKEFRS